MPCSAISCVYNTYSCRSNCYSNSSPSLQQNYGPTPFAVWLFRASHCGQSIAPCHISVGLGHVTCFDKWSASGKDMSSSFKPYFMVWPVPLCSNNPPREEHPLGSCCPFSQAPEWRQGERDSNPNESLLSSTWPSLDQPNCSQTSDPGGWK